VSIIRMDSFCPAAGTRRSIDLENPPLETGGHRFRAVAGVEFAQNSADVRLDGVFRDPQSGADIPVGESAEQQSEGGGFLRGEPSFRLTAGEFFVE